MTNLGEYTLNKWPGAMMYASCDNQKLVKTRALINSPPKVGPKLFA